MALQMKVSDFFGPNITLNIQRTLNLKSISIKINKNCIKINIPFLFSNKKIEELLSKKYTWIKKQLFIQSRNQTLLKKEYIDGEEFIYLGNPYKLKIIIKKKYSIKIMDGLLTVSVKDIDNIVKIKSLIKRWFLDQSASYFEKKTLYYAKKNNINVLSVKVKGYKARWGACSTKGDIIFNWRLIMAPPQIIDYVIIHELMHIREHNHSPKYWEHVKSVYPNIRAAKDWLMYNGTTLTI